MSNKRKAAVLVSVAMIAVIGAAAALAAGSALTPRLGSPNGKHVSPGRLQLTATTADATQVFAFVSRKHKLKHGTLVQCTSAARGCLVAKMTPWKHHKDGWTYTALNYNFPGFWATTPGKYYWQVQSFAKTPPCTNGDCTFVSKVGTFTVR
jgi:hypothetical protein